MQYVCFITLANEIQAFRKFKHERPQGSVLGPAVFTLHTVAIPLQEHGSHVRCCSLLLFFMLFLMCFHVFPFLFLNTAFLKF